MGASDHLAVVARLRLLPYAPGTARLRLPGAPPIELVSIPPPPGKTRGFLLGKYEVTNAQYAAFVRASGYDGADHPSSKPTEPFLAHWENGRPPPGLRDHPVAHVNWYHAVAFCRWASRVTGRRVRLPTHGEWTWAAAGGTGRAYPWGEGWDPRRANWGDRGRVDGYAGAAAVGSFPAGATPTGVHDLAGNIWEWTAGKTLRGGPWCGPPAWLRVDFVARREDPRRADDKFGFRVVVEP